MGLVTTLAGSAGNPGFADGINAQFDGPLAVAVAESGDVFVADQANRAVRRVSAGGVVSTVAGNRESIGILEGELPGSLGSPSAIEVMPGMPLRLAVADSRENVVLLITP